MPNHIKHLVETTLGKFLFTITDENHIYVSNETVEYQQNRIPFTVNGKEMRSLSVHFHRNEASGEFDVGMEQRGGPWRWVKGRTGLDNYVLVTTFYMKREGGADSTLAMQTKAYTLLVDALNAWVKANPKYIGKARKNHLIHEINQAEEALEAAKEQVSELEEKIKTLRSRIIGI